MLQKFFYTNLTFLIFIFSSFALANSTPIALTPQPLLEDLSQEGQYLGFSLANHSSVLTLEYLDQFLEKVGSRNPSLKFIAIEGPHEVSPLFEAASTNIISMTEFEEQNSPRVVQVIYG